MASIEEVLARQVIEKINRWRREEEKNSPPRIAIKFCGGCNPYFERGAVARIIKKELPEGHWVSADEETDLLVIINGCLLSCAQRPEIEEKTVYCLSIGGENVSDIYNPPKSFFKN